ncbi:uncharacterized protein LOC122067277 [Macadamia integrifolia]|uniref:uncharacterized protein LOC122067277 n=1 Tax=Macadamia integrifolia TaxID=60698 RepID=UPI001C4F2E95|nr:uncharacterized protein LOC122067277 [Macadamia integrifolia]
MVPPPYQYYLVYPPYYPSAATTVRQVESFKRHLPLIFPKVGSDPLEPDRWIQELEKIFEIVECTESQKLIYAGLQLRNEADSWWKATKPILLATHPEPTWEQFKEMFLSNYYPSSFRDRKATEFSSLIQGNKSVFEYQQQFEELFYFTPPNIKTAKEKAKKFLKGLKKAKTIEDKQKGEPSTTPGL